MDIIKTFLDNMFAPYPATLRLVETRSELRAVMGGAYNGAIAQDRTYDEAVGQIITDLGNLHELAPILSITQDIQPGGAPRVAPAGAPMTSEPNRPAGPAPTNRQASWDDSQDGDPSINFVARIYWPAAVVIYLLWSLIFDAWDVSWILWPVTTVAFAIFVSVRNYRYDRQ